MTEPADDASSAPPYENDRADDPAGEPLDDETQEEVDGRKLRRASNRELVLSSLLELVEDGNLAPTAAQIAERSGVSLRSVFRYFEDRDQLLREAASMAYGRYSELARIHHFGRGTFEDRLAAIIDQRLVLFAAIAPIVRVRYRTLVDPILSETIIAETQPLHEQVVQQFEPELAGLEDDHREPVTAALTALLSPEVFDLFVDTQGRDHDEVREIYTAAVRALIGPSTRR